MGNFGAESTFFPIRLVCRPQNVQKPQNRSILLILQCIHCRRSVWTLSLTWMTWTTSCMQFAVSMRRSPVDSAMTCRHRLAQRHITARTHPLSFPVAILHMLHGSTSRHHQFAFIFGEHNYMLHNSTRTACTTETWDERTGPGVRSDAFSICIEGCCQYYTRQWSSVINQPAHVVVVAAVHSTFWATI